MASINITGSKRLSCVNRFIKSTTKRPNKTKKVRFSRTDKHIPALCCNDNDGTLWYQPEDYADFRMQAAVDAENVIVQMQALTDCISHVYEVASRMASNSSDEISLMELLRQSGPDFQLLIWCNAMWSRGNEKTVLNAINFEEIARVRVNHRDTILLSQKKCDANALRLQSEQLSRANRIFARMMGTADACIALRSSPARKKRVAVLPVKEEELDEEVIHTVSAACDLIHPRQFCPQQA